MCNKGRWIIMVWETRQGVQKSPSTYSADIDDSDNDSYTSIEDGSLIDNPVVVGMLKIAMEFDCATEEEAEEILSRTWENPLVATVKVPVVPRWNIRKCKVPSK